MIKVYAVDPVTNVIRKMDRFFVRNAASAVDAASFYEYVRGYATTVIREKRGASVDFFGVAARVAIRSEVNRIAAVVR